MAILLLDTIDIQPLEKHPNKGITTHFRFLKINHSVITMKMNTPIPKTTISQIILKDDLNKIGLFRVSINLHSEVQASLSIKIDKIQSK